MGSPALTRVESSWKGPEDVSTHPLRQEGEPGASPGFPGRDHPDRNVPQLVKTVDDRFFVTALHGPSTISPLVLAAL